MTEQIARNNSLKVQETLGDCENDSHSGEDSYSKNKKSKRDACSNGQDVEQVCIC
jgi:hypothetical protein